jgi:hypothetical protein
MLPVEILCSIALGIEMWALGLQDFSSLLAIESSLHGRIFLLESNHKQKKSGNDKEQMTHFAMSKESVVVWFSQNID